jgi:tRNA nucleotidyltransferase/poly(A) polymerase
LATDAQPQDINKILTSQEAQLNGIKVFPKGEAFGVISAIVNGQEYEIATFREEWYDPEKGDGRRPDQVSFSTPGKDAQRRDLTMNALFYDVDKKEIRDYNVDEAGRGLGLQDIKNLVARPVGNAKGPFRPTNHCSY